MSKLTKEQLDNTRGISQLYALATNDRECLNHIIDDYEQRHYPEAPVTEPRRLWIARDKRDDGCTLFMNKPELVCWHPDFPKSWTDKISGRGPFLNNKIEAAIHGGKLKPGERVCIEVKEVPSD